MPHVAISTLTLHKSLGTGITVDGRETEDAQVFLANEGDEVIVEELTKEQQESVLKGHLKDFIVEVTDEELAEIQARREAQLTPEEPESVVEEVIAPKRTRKKSTTAGSK